jgi:uncharacterized coiled-coil DUF342 family protein
MYQDKVTEFYNIVYETKKNTEDLKKWQEELKKQLEEIEKKLAILEEKINWLKEWQIKIEYRIEKNNINSKYYNDKIDLDELNTELEKLMWKYVEILNSIEWNDWKTRKDLLK